MIETADIRNFRCFESLRLDQLKRFNIIAGKNASGKTALLEALFIASGSTPELALRLKVWRGMQTVAIANHRSAYDELWRDLFYCFDQSKPIKISMTGSPLDTRSVTISYREQQTILIPLPAEASAVDASPIVPIVFQWTDAGGRVSTSIPTVTPAGLSITPEGGAASMPTAFYSSANIIPANENAIYFSNCSIRHTDKAIVEGIKREFPQVAGMTSETRPGGSNIYVTVNGISEKVPINLLSSGITKLVSLLLGIANQPGGIIFIDEIENGFYYDRMKSHITMLMQFCKTHDVQIFATTHSSECLTAAAAVEKEFADEFSLIRLEKPNGQSGTKQFTGKLFRSAIEQGREVR